MHWPCSWQKKRFIENTGIMKLKHWKSLGPLLQWNVYSQQENARKDWKSLEVIRMAKPPFPSSWALQGGSALVSTVPKPGKASCWNRTIKENTEKSCKIDTSDTCEILFGYIVRPVWNVCIPFILTILGSWVCCFRSHTFAIRTFELRTAS